MVAIVMLEPIAAALPRHIVRLPILPRRATVALPIRRRAIRLHATPLHLRTIAAIRRILRQAIAALLRRNHPAPVAMVEGREGAVAAMVEAEVPEAAMAAVSRE